MKESHRSRFLSPDTKFYYSRRCFPLHFVQITLSFRTKRHALKLTAFVQKFSAGFWTSKKKRNSLLELVKQRSVKKYFLVVFPCRKIVLQLFYWLPRNTCCTTRKQMASPTIFSDILPCQLHNFRFIARIRHNRNSSTAKCESFGQV